MTRACRRGSRYRKFHSFWAGVRGKSNVNIGTSVPLLKTATPRNYISADQLRETKQKLASSLPELDILLLCRSHANPQEATQFRVRALQNGDWAPTFKLAERHGLMPLLYWNLQSHCPEATNISLHDRFKSNAVHNLAHMQELLRILQCFGAASIPAIPYKGPVLATCVYKNLALREFFDLDILVDVADVPRAAQLLAANGYQCETQLSEVQLRSYLSSGCELCFERDGVAVEVHWRIAPQMYSLPFPFPELWARRQTISFGQQENSENRRSIPGSNC